MAPLTHALRHSEGIEASWRSPVLPGVPLYADATMQKLA